MRCGEVWEQLDEIWGGLGVGRGDLGQVDET